MNEKSRHSIHVMEKTRHERKNNICAHKSPARYTQQRVVERFACISTNERPTAPRQNKEEQNNNCCEIHCPAKIQIIQRLVQWLRMPHVVKLAGNHVQAFNEIHEPHVFRVGAKHVNDEETINHADRKIELVEPFAHSLHCDVVDFVQNSANCLGFASLEVDHVAHGVGEMHFGSEPYFLTKIVPIIVQVIFARLKNVCTHIVVLAERSFSFGWGLAINICLWRHFF